MRFIDLFAGLGGFHLGLSRLGHECVFASEIKESLADLYAINFGIKPHRDIRTVAVSDIPDHDILCGGFPCQPFSKAGRQKGLEDESNGDLFGEIVRILRHHQPTYFILENVQNLARHANEETYQSIAKTLKHELGYDIRGEILSPHEFGIPQHRQRLFIVGRKGKDSLGGFAWPEKTNVQGTVHDWLADPGDAVVALEKEKVKCLDIWQELLDRIPPEDKLPSFPIWAMEFGATYPFEGRTPFYASNHSLGRFKGSFGVPLKGMSHDQKLLTLPNYARPKQKKFPSWKEHFIRSNRAFYEQHKSRIKPVVKKIEELGVPSWQKFEWNVQGGDRHVRSYIIQFRGSGIRLKRADFFPSLVCVSTQIPVVGWQERYITKAEGARLQSMETLKQLPEYNSACFDALGNAVNARIVELIAQQLINETASKPIIIPDRPPILLPGQLTISKTA
jgi:DNA (cytosine-5)-methyltransferase 1